MNRICPVCHKMFDNKFKDATYCSHECFHQHRRGLPLTKRGTTKQCQQCGKDFYVSNGRASTAHFCSYSCNAKYHLKEVPATSRQCPICNTSFTPRPAGKAQKYCSSECRTIGRYANNCMRKTKTCERCGNEFTIQKGQSYQTRFCSQKCRSQHYYETHPLETYARNGMKRALEKRGVIATYCEECGYNEHPEILGRHHKDFNPKNGKKENFIVLCPNCHSIAHWRHITHGPGREKH